MPCSGEVETVKVHDLAPRRGKVFYELLLGVRASVGFRQGPELGVRTEDQVDTGAGPFDLARLPVTPLVHAFSVSGRLPLRAHVEKVDEEVISENFRSFGEDAVSGPFAVGLQNAHAAH